MWARVTYACFGLTIAMLAIGTGVPNGVLDGLAMAGIFAVVLSPLLATALFGSWAARCEAWIDVDLGRLTVHHPVFFRADLVLDNVTRSFFVGEASGYARPSAGAPDLLSVMGEARRWNLVLVFGEPFFLDRTPRRAIQLLRLFSRGSACLRAPRRRKWLRGLFAVAEEPAIALAALEGAGIVRIRELTPEVLRWLAGDGAGPSSALPPSA